MPGAAPRPMKMSLRGAAQTRSSQDVRTQRRSNLRHAPGIASPKVRPLAMTQAWLFSGHAPSTNSAQAAGLVAAVAYMAIPYHLVDVYVRAAMAESVALALLPLALWGFRAAVYRPRLAAILGAGAAYAAIMWTSPLVALVFTPALAAYVVALLWWRRTDEGQRDERTTVLDETSSFVLRPSSPRAHARLRVGPRLERGVLRAGDVGAGVHQPDAVVRPVLRPRAALRLLLPTVQPFLGLRHQQTGAGRYRPGRHELPTGRGSGDPVADRAGNGPAPQARRAARGLVLGAVGAGQHLPDARCLGLGVAPPADRALRAVPLALPDAGDPAAEHPARDAGGRWGWQVWPMAWRRQTANCR